jgi:hypothetical protein
LIFLGKRILSSDFWILFSHEFGGRILIHEILGLLNFADIVGFSWFWMAMVTVDPVGLDPV